MSPQQLVNHFGGITAAALALKLAAPSVHGWIVKGEIPIDRQCQIELVTNGALKADRNAEGMPVRRDTRAQEHPGSPFVAPAN